MSKESKGLKIDFFLILLKIRKMEFPVQTEKSALVLHELDQSKIELLQKCTEDVDAKLLFHPEIMVFGKSCRQNRSI